MLNIFIWLKECTSQPYLLLMDISMNIDFYLAVRVRGESQRLNGWMVS